MSYFILSDENETQIKGIFNQEDKIPLENGNLITYTRNLDTKYPDSIAQSIDTDEDILYIFFQNLSDKIENIKLFDSISKAQHYRETNYSYGYIIGFKINILYNSLLQCEYLSLKEIH
tara:strand:- start:2498 stop:2851 length:354 start_codon:yes stop_codon:yes gene_type:complete